MADECRTCAGPRGVVRPTSSGHAAWCWTADPSLPDLGDSSASHLRPIDTKGQ